MTMYGYARASTAGQTLEQQREQLQAAGCNVICAETISGAITDRPELNRAVMMLRTGDIFMVTRLDRVARSTRDLLNILAAISHEGAHFKSLAETWVDTTTPHGRLTITILGGLVEFERSLIAFHCNAGIVKARNAGVKFGPKPTITPAMIDDMIHRAARPERLVDIAKIHGIHPGTVSRIIAKNQDRVDEARAWMPSRNRRWVAAHAALLASSSAAAVPPAQGRASGPPHSVVRSRG
jgi:DNA invertase Pin-like site-specific DNA recombinase